MCLKKHLGKEGFLQLLKFVGVGLLNTLLSLAVINILMYVGVNYQLANLVGYVVGVINSFFWSKFWVFRSQKSLYKEALLFGIVFFFCYVANFMALLFLVEIFQLSPYIAQPMAMCVYTLLNFILNRTITFRKRN